MVRDLLVAERFNVQSNFRALSNEWKEKIVFIRCVNNKPHVDLKISDK
jgi:hypothetical protein